MSTAELELLGSAVDPWTVFIFFMSHLESSINFFATGIFFRIGVQDWVAWNGWRLLPAYSFCVETGEWHHRLSTPQQAISRGQSWLNRLLYG
jgi:hypothetical protein